MSAAQSDIILRLPLDAVCQSSGFSLDIGGSVAKLVYRSKEEYTGGKPHDENELQTGLGRVHLAMFPRENIHDVIAYVKEHCDILKTKECDTIHCCGLGGSEHLSILEAELSMKVKNHYEVHLMVDALCFMLEHYPDCCYPPSEEGIRSARPVIELLMNRYKKEGGEKDHYYDGSGQNSSTESSEEGVQYPIIMVMAGSGLAYFKIMDKEGLYTMPECTLNAGRFYLGLGSAITKCQDYPSIQQFVENGDGSKVDTQYKDVAVEVQKYAPDVYHNISNSGAPTDFRCKVMEKLLAASGEAELGEDVAHSFLHSLCEVYAHLAYYAARDSDVKTVYFCGNFANPAIVKKWITQYITVKNATLSKEESVEVKFVRHGGHVGAIGAFLLPYLHTRRPGGINY